MKTVTAEVESKHKVTGRILKSSIEVKIYTDEELKNFIELGLREKHAELLNKIIVIRAQDKKRRALIQDEDKAVKKIFAEKSGAVSEDDDDEEFSFSKDDDDEATASK